MALSPCPSVSVTLALDDVNDASAALLSPKDDGCESEMSDQQKLKLAASEGSDRQPTDHTFDFQHRVQKRRKVVEGILARYERKLPVEFLTFLLPNPEEHMPKREWERKMHQARHAFLIMASVCSTLESDSVSE